MSWLGLLEVDEDHEENDCGEGTGDGMRGGDGEIEGTADNGDKLLDLEGGMAGALVSLLRV